MYNLEHLRKPFTFCECIPMLLHPNFSKFLFFIFVLNTETIMHRVIQQKYFKELFIIACSPKYKNWHVV